jgi:signal transduction histidine kinase
MLEVSLSEPASSSTGEVLTAVIRDFTERRQVESQRAQTQKLESIGRLAAGIAHEINTPIQYIGDNGTFLSHAFADLVGHLQQDSVDEEVEYLQAEIPKAIDQLLEGAKHVATIVRAMKEFSHPGRVEKTPVDLRRTIENVVAVSRNEWKYVADLSVDFDATLPLVPCIGAEFNQVMLNLIVNAAHAIADVVGDTGKKGAIRISTQRVGETAEVRIHDTGCGIPEAIRGKVFDPFFTTKGVGKGTGQGLALAHAVIVRKHGGTLRFETEAGAGTTFIVQLPLADTTPPDAGEAELTRSAPSIAPE